MGKDLEGTVAIRKGDDDIMYKIQSSEIILSRPTSMFLRTCYQGYLIKKNSELSRSQRWDEVKNTKKITRVKALILYKFLHYLRPMKNILTTEITVEEMILHKMYDNSV